MRIKNKIKFIRSITILIFFLIVMFNTVIAKTNNNTTMDYTVCKGETLWSIARDYKEENQDTREYIYQLKKINNTDISTIYAGQTIKIIKGQ